VSELDSEIENYADMEYKNWISERALEHIQAGEPISAFLKDAELPEQMIQIITTKVALTALGRNYCALETVLKLVGLNKNELETLIEAWYYEVEAQYFDDVCKRNNLRFKTMEPVDMIVKRLLRMDVSKELIADATKISIDAITIIERWLR